MTKFTTRFRALNIVQKDRVILQCAASSLFLTLCLADHGLFIFKIYYLLDVPSLLTGLSSFFYLFFFSFMCHHLTNSWSVIKNEFKCNFQRESLHLDIVFPSFTYLSVLCKYYNFLSFYLSFINMSPSRTEMTITSSLFSLL